MTTYSNILKIFSQKLEPSELLLKLYSTINQYTDILELSFNIGNPKEGVVNKYSVNQGIFNIRKIPLLRVLRRDSSFRHNLDSNIWIINDIRDKMPSWIVPLINAQNFMPTIIMALRHKGEHQGALTLSSNKSFVETDKELLLAIQDSCSAFCVEKLVKHKQQAPVENLYPSFEEQTGENLIGLNGGLKQCFNKVRLVASTNSPVILFGETGTGKEVLARTIHNLSSRRTKAFIAVNCGAIPEGLLDSELFGHEKGAFTNAVSKHLGYFEQANGGTILLDEIGELPPSAQTRLLRILQEKKLQRVGGSQTISVDIRILAATHRDLKAMLAQGTFREDLYYRLKIVEIAIPPLRERKQDILELADFFIKQKAPLMSLPTSIKIPESEIPYLLEYSWPGNIRELENTVENALIFSDNNEISFTEIIPGFVKHNTDSDKSSLELNNVIRKHIEKILILSNGQIQGEKGAAKILACEANTLRKRMQKLGINYKKFKHK